jgi:hypothetical protein
MNMLLRAFGVAFVFLAGAAAAAEPVSFQAGAQATYTAAPVHPLRYSFVDVYHLTVAGAMAGEPRDGIGPEPVRVAMAPAAEPRFSIVPVRQPEKWLLVLAGLALAGWVAHRRLTHPL